DAVDLADDRVILRLSRLEQLGDARQTAGDVLHLGRVARDLGDWIARRDVLAVLRDDVRADRQEVARFEIGARQLERLAGFRIRDRDARPWTRRAALNHDLARQTRDLVDLFDDGDALDQIAVAQHAADLGEDRRREWIPLRHDFARADTRAILDLEHGT